MKAFFLALLALGAFPASAQPRRLVTLREYVSARVEFRDTKNQRSAVADEKVALDRVCDIERDLLAARVFLEYGAVFVASDKVMVPPTCIFNSETEVERFQVQLQTRIFSLGGVQIELQSAAADALQNAVDEALKNGKRITPLDGAIAGKRIYSDTLRIWNSRFFRALDHWVFRGRITREEANYASSLPIRAQIERVMAWEANGYYFSTNFSRSIFNSVAPPGTSQHLSLLAFDVVESSDPAIRQILNNNGWFQTIRSDEPHFTYLGVAEHELPSRGLMPVKRNGRTYWVPIV